MKNGSCRVWVMVALLLPLAGAVGGAQSPALDRQLFVAAARGDMAAVTSLLDKGANINVENFGVTPLYSAADQGNLPLVKLLLERGASFETQDLEWGKTVLGVTISPFNAPGSKQDRAEIIRLLVEKGAGTNGEDLDALIQRGYLDEARAIVARGKVDPVYLNMALAAANRAKQTEMVALLTKAGAKELGPLDSARSPERLKLVAGVYRSDSGEEMVLRQTANGDELVLDRAGKPRLELLPATLTILRTQDMRVWFRLPDTTVPPLQVTFSEGGRPVAFKRVGDAPALTSAAASAPSRAARTEPSPARPGASSTVAKTRHWPSFRGPNAAGVADGVHLPTTWDVSKGANVLWKTPIPGLAHSSPVVWGDRVFITTAVPAGEVTFSPRGGGYSGFGASSDTKDDVPHAWRVYALDKRTGKILWERVAHEGIPRTARHWLESQANSTPATDGQHLAVFFGSEGLYCYTVDGKLLWKKDLGPLSSGRFLDPGYEWNTAGSPIIYKNRVYLQVDLVDNSFLAAYDVKTGRELWRAKREELPAWTTPLVYEGPQRTELVTAAANYARAYDPDTGKELWRLGKHSNLPTPSPIAGRGLIFITSGSGNTIQPIYAVRPGATGDITLKDGEASNEYVVWSKRRDGPFTPTPVLYDDLLYVCSDSGVLAAYEAETGERVYQERLTRGGNYSASPVAGDGKLYFPSEDGEVIVVKAGRKFEKLAVNNLGEVLMATPAISGDMLLFRTQHHVVAIGDSTMRESAAR